MRRKFLAAIIVVTMAGCQSPSGQRHITSPGARTSVQSERHLISGEVVPPELNNARTAAKVVASMPPVRDAHARLEIKLHTALYKAAHTSRIECVAEHFFLVPAVDETQKSVAVSNREFHLRVLAELDSLDVPLAWLAESNRAAEVFPGTRSPASHLRIRITERIEDQATVMAEIGCVSRQGSTTRQVVSAVWDGRAWQIRPTGVRLVW